MSVPTDGLGSWRVCGCYRSSVEPSGSRSAAGRGAAGGQLPQHSQWLHIRAACSLATSANLQQPQAAAAASSQGTLFREGITQLSLQIPPSLVSLPPLLLLLPPLKLPPPFLPPLLQGPENSLEFRIFLQSKGATASPWHDIPLFAGDGLVNFVCEIPKETSAKMEVATVSDDAFFLFFVHLFFLCIQNEF